MSASESLTVAHLQAAVPDTGASLRLAGLGGEVLILRDRWGIPHVRAGDARDAFFGQGFATAQDRLWHMDWDRRRATGRAAEIAGAPLVEQDELMRRMQLGDSARQDYAACQAESREMLDGYAAGVNAWIAQGQLPVEYRLVGAAPDPWQPWESLAVFKVRHVLMGSFPAKLWRARVVATLGAQQAARLFPGYPADGLVISPPAAAFGGLPAELAPLFAELEGALKWMASAEAGSNSWALAGSRTASGRPLLAGDPHRLLEVPNVYYQNHVTCPQFDTIGLSFPGVPGMPHFGHNATVAWCVTHACADYQDLYVEQLRVHKGVLQCRTANGWRKAQTRGEQIAVAGSQGREVELISTPRGPLIAGGRQAGWGLSLRYTATAGSNPQSRALRRMLGVSSAAEMDQVMVDWVDPCNSFLMADTDGAVRYLHRGRVPLRSPESAWLPVPGWEPRHAWRGMVAFDDMPRVVDPAEGFIVTANNKVTAADYPHFLGLDYAPEYRARRLLDHIQELTGATVADMRGLHGEQVSLPGTWYRDRIVELALDVPSLQGAQKLLADWDGEMGRDSAAAALYSAFRVKLNRRVIGALLGSLAQAGLADPGRGGALHVAALAARLAADCRDRRADLLPAGITWEMALSEALRDAVAELSQRLGTDQNAWRWGDLHVTAARHPLAQRFPRAAGALSPTPVALGGDGDTPRAASHLPVTGFAVAATSVARYVFDVADWDASRWVVPLGASGHPGSGHFADQGPLWAELGTVPMIWSWSVLEASAESRQTLSPPAQG